MTSILFGLIFIGLGLVAVALQRFYSSVPLRELKRLSKRGDTLAQALFRPAAYEKSLRLFLWLVAGISLAIGLLLIIPNVSGLVGFIVAVLVLAAVLVWVPSLQLTVHTAQFAAWLSPVIVPVVRTVHPVFSRLAELISRGRTLTQHSRLYEKEDLATLLSKQKEQPDNRIAPEDLELLRRTLEFGDKRASDVLLPRKKMHMVSADDTIGPILLDQLHKSGQTSFLVYKDEKDVIIGALLMRDAVNARAGGRVGNLARNDLCYVHEDFTLRQVVTAFQKTGHHLAIVLNSFEEIVGVISLDSMLAELVGSSDEATENYESPAAIAAYKPLQPAKDTEESKPEEPATNLEDDLPTSPDATGVVK